jgi:hypothetical protein
MRRLNKQRSWTAFVVAASLSSVGCRASTATEDKDDHEGIPECREYQTAFAACRHQPVAKDLLAMVPSDDAERDRLKHLCSVNLTRLREACR